MSPCAHPRPCRPSRSGLLRPAHGFRPPDPAEVRRSRWPGGAPASDPEPDREAGPTASPSLAWTRRWSRDSPRPRAVHLPIRREPRISSPRHSRHRPLGPFSPPSRPPGGPPSSPARPRRRRAGPDPDPFPVASPHMAPPAGPDEGSSRRRGPAVVGARADPAAAEPSGPQTCRRCGRCPRRRWRREASTGAPPATCRPTSTCPGQGGPRPAGHDGEAVGRWDVLRERLPARAPGVMPPARSTPCWSASPPGSPNRSQQPRRRSSEAGRSRRPLTGLRPRGRPRRPSEVGLAAPP